MKRATAWLLLVPVLLQAGGVLFLCAFMQLRIHLDVQNTLLEKPHQLEHITLSVDQFRAGLKDRNEIKIDGRLYDVLEMTPAGKEVELLVYCDLREQEILSLLEDFLNGEDTAGDFTTQLQKLLTANYLLPKSYSEFPASECVAAILHTQPLHFSAAVTDRPTPPPKFLA